MASERADYRRTRKVLYTGCGVAVTGEYVVTKVCAPKDESCEDTYGWAELTVSTNDRTEVLR